MSKGPASDGRLHPIVTETPNFQPYLQILLAVAALSVSVAAAAVAYFQFRLARSKFQFDALDRRLAIYDNARRHISHSINPDRPPHPDDPHLFKTELLASALFHNDDIASRLRQLRDRSLQLFAAKEEIKVLEIGAERTKKAAEIRDAKAWILEQDNWFRDQIVHASRISELERRATASPKGLST